MKAHEMNSHDVAIVGGGPGGAAAALYLLQQGVRPVILEKHQFPRYHIGESLTGECGACLRRLGMTDAMLAERWPIKHGVKVWGAGGKNSFWVEVAERGPDHRLRPNWTWQVLRSKFDQMLLDLAVARGAELIPHEACAPLVDGDRVTGVSFRTPGGAVEKIRAEVVIDASGQTTFLANKGITSRKERGQYDKQVAIFSQLAGSIRDPGEAGGNTLIFYRQKHHWAWFIPLDDEAVSVGVVCPSDYFTAQKLSKAEFLRQELVSLNPELSQRITNLDFVEEVRSASNYSYHIQRFTGKGFLCVGDAHRFIDPIFSFGLFFAIKEAQFAADAVARYLAGEGRDAPNPFAAYETYVDQGQQVIQDLVDCFWDFPLAFLILVHHSHREDMIDLFAGRIYGEEVNQSSGVTGMRRLLAKRSPEQVARVAWDGTDPTAIAN